jgi:hypothetical protein
MSCLSRLAHGCLKALHGTVLALRTFLPIMHSADDYRKRSEYCVLKANQSGTSQTYKTGLLQLAAHWKEMADHAERVASIADRNTSS